MPDFDIDSTDPGGWKQTLVTIAVVLWDQVSKDPVSSTATILMVVFWSFRLFRQWQKMKEGKAYAQQQIKIKNEELRQAELKTKEDEANLQYAKERLEYMIIERKKAESIDQQENEKDDV